MTGTIAITMAGMGSRFTKAGYTRPKYEIAAHGVPLFDWSMLSLEAFRTAGWRFDFIARKGLDAADYIQSRANALGISDYGVQEIDGLTDGQATTALLSAEKAAGDQPFAIYNIDTFVAPGAMTPPDPQGCTGWMPCFAAPGDGWSFARTDEDGKVVEVREKKRISDHATLGLYWFDSAARYVKLYQDYYAVAGREEKGERYVAPLYNALIDQNAVVQISTVALEDVGMLGTPDQVDAFIASPPPAAQRYIQNS